MALYCWGDNSYGQLPRFLSEQDKWGLGVSDKEATEGAERKVESAIVQPNAKDALVLWPHQTKVNSIAAGSFHSLFCTEFGQVYACGRNLEGQCGTRVERWRSSEP